MEYKDSVIVMSFPSQVFQQNKKNRYIFSKMKTEQYVNTIIFIFYILHFSISILVGSVGGVVVLSPSVYILVSAGAGFSSFLGSGFGLEITCL